MERCSWCGAVVAADAEWCPKCSQPISSSEPGVPVAWHATRRRTRWHKTATSFGPVGRLTWTVVAALPVAGCLFGLISHPGPRGGAIWVLALAVYALLFLPWVLRDVWKAVWLPIEDEGRARRAADLSNLKFPGTD